MENSGTAEYSLVKDEGPNRGGCAKCCGSCCGQKGRRGWAGCCGCFLFMWIGLWAYALSWQNGLIAELASQTTIADTKLGKIEYWINGSAPYILFIHGQASGWDCVKIPNVIDFWQAAGYGIISPARPGYTRTPLTKYPYSVEDQVDLMAALLDELGIEKVLVQGFSGGGPHAAWFAAKHARKTVGLLLGIALVETKVEPPNSPCYGVDGKGNVPMSWRVFSWIMASPITSFLTYQFLAEGDPSANVDQMFAQVSNFTAEEAKTEKTRILADPKALAVVQGMTTTTLPFSIRLPEGQLNDCATENPLHIPLDTIKCPTYLVYGVHDNPDTGVSPSNYYTALKEIPHVNEHYYLEGGYHVIWAAPEWPDQEAKQLAFAAALDWSEK